MYFFAGLCWVHTAHTFPLQKNLVYSLSGQECYFHFVLIRSLVSLASNWFLSRPPFIIVSFLSFINPNISSMGSFSSSWLLNQAMKTTPSWIHGSLAVLVPIHSCLLFVVCLFFVCFSYWGQAGWIPGCTGSGAGGRTAPVSYMCTAPKTIFEKKICFFFFFKCSCVIHVHWTCDKQNEYEIRQQFEGLPIIALELPIPPTTPLRRKKSGWQYFGNHPERPEGTWGKKSNM